MLFQKRFVRIKFDIYVCFYYYHWVGTSAGGLLRSPLRVYLPSSQCYYHWVGTSAGGLLVPVEYHLLSSQCYYHWVGTSAGDY